MIFLLVTIEMTIEMIFVIIISVNFHVILKKIIWRSCGGIVTRILATLMWNTESRSVSKSSAARASLVCSSMPRIPFQPPHWTRRPIR